jgi:hypothetical protein
LSFEGASPVDAAQSAPPAPPSPESPPPAKASRRRFAIGLAALAAGVVATGILVFTPRPPSDSNWSGAFVERTDPKFQHTVALHISGGTIEGTYFYNKRRQNLDLRGTLQGRRFTMEEFLSGKKTATFTGEFSSDWKTASGTWVHVDNGTTLNFQWSRGPQSAPLTR